MSPDPETIAAGFDTVSLARLDGKAAFRTRLDNKYYLEWKEFEAFAAGLRGSHTVLEIGARRVFVYDTMYFDTASLYSHHSYTQGRRKRFKCRSRYYADSGLCFFEVKLKSSRGQIVKRRMDYDRADFAIVSPDAREFLRTCLREEYGMELTGPLRPTLRTYYRRMTLVAHDGGDRITCDFGLSLMDQGGSAMGMSDQHVLIETKTERGRGAADHALWHMGKRPIRGSKYDLGIALFHPAEKSNRLRRTLKRYFEPREDAGSPT